MRPELLDTKAQKIRFWIDDVDVKVKRRLEERIKYMPATVDRQTLAESHLRRSATKEDNILGVKSLGTLSEEAEAAPRSIQMQMEQEATLQDQLSETRSLN